MDRKPEEEKMAPMKAVCGKRYFLVDFENVGPDGIENAGRLSSSDFVHLFCTKNSGKICPSVLAGFNSTNLFVHVVPQGSQSVDMHIVSFLGNLIGDKDSRGEYIIVSRDTDYDNVIHFWQTERKAAVKRQEKLIETGRAKQGEAKPASAQMTEKKTGGTAGKKAAKAQQKAAKKQEASAAQGSAKAPEAKTQQKAVKKQEAPEAKVSAKVPEAKAQQKAAKKQEAPEAKVSAKVPEAKAQQKAVKKQEAPAAQGSAKNLSAKAEQKAVSQQKTAQEQKPAGQTKEAASKAEKNRIAKEKVKLNSAVMKALSKAKYDNSVIGFVSSQAAKHYSDANRKQVMHGVIVQKYGQEKGLEIYKKIREFL